MASKYANITASGLIKEGPGCLTGMVVASTTSGTIKFWDQTSAATPVLINTLTPSAGSVYLFPDGGITFTRGLYVTVANTLDCTVFYE